MILGLVVLLTILLWASAFPGIRAALAGGFPPTHLVLLRFIVASAFFGVFALFGKIRRPRKQDAVGILVTGFLAVVVYQLALNFGERTVESGAASLLINSAPIWTTLLAVVFLKERLILRQWLGVAVGFLGVVLIAGGAGQGKIMSAGALLVLLASFAHSTAFIIQKPLLPHYTPLEFAAYELWAGTLFLLPLSGGLTATLKQATPAATFSVIYLGIGPAALAFSFWAYLLGRLPAYRAASFLYFVPACAIGIAWLWLGEIPSWLSMGGGLLSIAGVILVNRPPKKAVSYFF